MFDLSKEKASPGLEEFSLEFYEDRKEELETMLACLANNDLSSIRALAHKWKGFSVPYGFNSLEGLSISLEKSTERECIDETKLLINKISTYLELKGDILGAKSK
ncbi:hypothetical protein [Halobacteriovorax sp.]|uniref:hypothetical protein n=1 Tax=Halobacteriovorax sp. TaxID=2020862 RepID=UPI003563F73D